MAKDICPQCKGFHGCVECGFKGTIEVPDPEPELGEYNFTRSYARSGHLIVVDDPRFFERAKYRRTVIRQVAVTATGIPPMLFQRVQLLVEEQGSVPMQTANSIYVLVANDPQFFHRMRDRAIVIREVTAVAVGVMLELQIIVDDHGPA